MNLTEIACALEAVLFASGESVHEYKLCAVLGIEKDMLNQVVKELADYYDYNRRGIKLLKLDESYQLCSRSDYAQMVRNALETRRAQSLSQASLEVLAIIAYKQPVTKTYIEQVRGVDSSYTVNSLAEKGLIVDCGRLDVPGRPVLYQTTEGFLRSFGLSSLSELPDLSEIMEEQGMEQLSLSLPAEVSS